MSHEQLLVEFSAKAGVLGMRYNLAGHYFYEADVEPRDRKRYDADTLDELTAAQVDERRGVDYGYTRFVYFLHERAKQQGNG